MSKPSLMDRIKNASSKAAEAAKAASDRDKDRYPHLFRLTKNERGGNSIVLRLMPSINDGESPILQYDLYSSFEDNIHFRAPPKNSGIRDVVNEAAWKFYKEGEKELFKSLISSQRYVSNAYVIKDTATPANEGKVVIIDYGRQLRNLIEATITGDADEPANPFDLLQASGLASLNLSWRVTSPANQKFPKYEFTFQDDGGAFGKRPDLEEIYSACHDLQAYINWIPEATAEQLQGYLDLKTGVKTPFGISSYGKPKAKLPEPESEPVKSHKPVVEEPEVVEEDESDDAEGFFKD